MEHKPMLLVKNWGISVFHNFRSKPWGNHPYLRRDPRFRLLFWKIKKQILKRRLSVWGFHRKKRKAKGHTAHTSKRTNYGQQRERMFSMKVAAELYGSTLGKYLNFEEQQICRERLQLLPISNWRNVKIIAWFILVQTFIAWIAYSQPFDSSVFIRYRVQQEMR